MSGRGTEPAGERPRVCTGGNNCMSVSTGMGEGVGCGRAPLAAPWPVGHGASWRPLLERTPAEGVPGVRLCPGRCEPRPCCGSSPTAICARPRALAPTSQGTWAWFRIPARSLCGCVTLGQLPPVSEPQLPGPENGGPGWS